MPSGSFPPSTEQAEHKAIQILYDIATKNTNTTFYRESSHLQALKQRLETRPEDLSSPGAFHNAFKETVGFSKYPDYAPFVKRLTEPEGGICHEKSVRDLLSPGLPILVAQTSGTSGSSFKHFPKYPHVLYSILYPPNPEPRSKCNILSAKLRKHLNIYLEDGATRPVPVTFMTAGIMRVKQGITPFNEEEMARQYESPSAVSPLAVAFIPDYDAMMTMNFFFALIHSTLQVIAGTFTIYINDGINAMMGNWTHWIDCIEKGIPPPELDLGRFAYIIKENIEPNAERAERLRSIRPGGPGWLKDVWPALREVICSASGVYALPIDKIRHHLGPTVRMTSAGLNCTECIIASPSTTKPDDIHLYQLRDLEFVEFLDIDEEAEPSNLRAPWEVEIGKQYELCVTTHDGLWRYLQEDIVKIAGFDPTTGFPLLRFVERKGSRLRIQAEFMSDLEFTNAVISAGQVLGPVLEFTTVVNDKIHPRGYGFFIELVDPERIANTKGHPADPNTLLREGVEKIDKTLRRNIAYQMARESNDIVLPTIWIVEAGTFSQYRRWKVGKQSLPVGQTKIPVAIIDPEAIRWLDARVIADSYPCTVAV